MTKKDYELIARCLRQFYYETRKICDHESLRLTFATVLKAANPNFNEEKFLSAASPEELNLAEEV